MLLLKHINKKGVYMKKRGFTLAEILVALGIIGVIAAMTMPTFTASTANAKIGPSLATAVSNFEQANAAMLQANNVEKITEAVNGGMASSYPYKIEQYMKVSKKWDGSDTPVLMTKSGVTYTFDFLNAAAQNNYVDKSFAHMVYIGKVTIDINGNGNPNSLGVDQFVFGMFDDGSLRPKGGHQSWNNTDDNYWDTKCPSSPVAVVDSSYCAGSIFENDLKVLY